MKRIHAALPLAALALSLAACGGGGNESGPPDRMYVSLDAVNVTGGIGCAVGAGPEVHVYGGQPPYKLANSMPQGMVLNKTVVQNSGDSFLITLTGVCMDAMPITLEDQLGNLAKVTVTNQPKT